MPLDQRFLSGPLKFGEPAGVKFFGEFFARRDVSVQPGNRRFGLVVQIVEQCQVAAQRFLVAVELDGDPVDLRGDVVELFGEAAQTRLGGGEEMAYKNWSLSGSPGRGRAPC